MGISKSDFVKNLLKDKTINSQQREKVFDLVARDFVNSDEILNKIAKDVEDIKNGMSLKPQEVVNSQTAPEVIKMSDEVWDEMIQAANPGENESEAIIRNIKYINPKGLSDFLSEYNQDPILKYTCHTIDNSKSFNNILDECHSEKYEFKRHLELIHRRYKKLTYSFKDKVLKNIMGLISTYLGTYNFEKGWSENIKIKWTSPELETWTNQYPGKVPNPLGNFQNERFRFSTIELKNGESISNFSDLVIHFKHLFHIKNTNPLKSLIENSIFLNFNNQDDYKFSFDECFSNNIDLFTYTEALIQTFNKIIEMSKKYHENEKLDVKLCFDYDENHLKRFKIIILNSKIFGKNFIDFRIGDDIQNLIKHQINGLCDFYIKAYFDDKKCCGFVNIWNGKPMNFEPIEGEIEGVEFILKMH